MVVFRPVHMMNGAPLVTLTRALYMNFPTSYPPGGNADCFMGEGSQRLLKVGLLQQVGQYDSG